MGHATIDARLASNPAAFLKLLSTLIDGGEGEKALALAEQALAEAPDGSPLASAALIALSHGVPRYHWGMLADEARNRAFEAAIARAAPNARLVLDIGAGSGLLAMMAARAGAAKVVTCEANPVLAATAASIITANQLGERIRLISKHSTSLDPESDLGGAADLIVTETFGHNLVGEGALPAIADALQRLTSPNVRVIPASAAAMVSLAQFEGGGPAVGEVCGFDLSLLNRDAPLAFTLAADNPSILLMSEPAALFKFSLSARTQPTEASLELVSTGGRIDGVVQWLRLELDEETAFEQPPGPSAQSHWKAVCWPINPPLETRPGETITVRGWTDLTNLRVWAAPA